MMVSAGQIKAARALLGLTREALAEAAKLSAATIRNMELGFISYRSADVVRQVLETAGIEFLENDGLRRKSEDLRVLRGADSPQLFYDDMMETLQRRGGEFCAVVPSEDVLLDLIGASCRAGGEKLSALLRQGGVRCLLTGDQNDLPRYQAIAYRMISKQMAGPMSYFIYGKKYAMALPGYASRYQMILFQAAEVARGYQDHFEILWKNAMPLLFERKSAEARS